MRVSSLCLAALLLYLALPEGVAIEELTAADEHIGRRAGGEALEGALNLAPGVTSNTAGNE